MSRSSLLLVLALLSTSIVPAASAQPVDDASRFTMQQVGIVTRSASAAVAGGLNAYQQAGTSLVTAGGQVTAAGLNASFGAAQSGVLAVAALGQGALTAGAVGANGTSNATRELGNGSAALYGGASTALDLATGNARNASSILVGDSLDNFGFAGEDVMEEVDQAVAPALGALGAFGPVVDGALGITAQAREDAQGAATTLVADGLDTYYALGTDTVDASGALIASGITTYHATAGAAVNAFGAAGAGALNAQNQIAKDSVNVTANATATALIGSNAAAHVVAKSGSNALAAGLQTYQATGTAAVDTVGLAVGDGLNAYYATGHTALNAGSDAIASGLNAYASLGRAGVGVLRAGLGPAEDALAPYARACAGSEGGGLEVAGSSGCLGQGIIGFEDGTFGDDGSNGASAPASQGSDGPATANSADSGPSYGPDPYSCPSTVAGPQYGFRVRLYDGSARSVCVPLALTASGFGQTQLINDVDHVRLDYNRQSGLATLTFSHTSYEVTGFTIVVDRTALDLDNAIILPSQVTLKLDGISVGLFGEASVATSLKLTYAGGSGADWTRFKFTPNKAERNLGHTVQLGRFDEAGGRRSAGGIAPSGFTLQARFEAIDNNRGKIGFTLDIPDATPIKVVVGNRGGNIPILIDRIPAHTVLNMEFTQRGTDYFQLKGNLDLGAHIVERAWIAVQDVDVKLERVSSLQSLTYTQVNVWANPYAPPCDTAIVDKLGDAATGKEQWCVEASTITPGARILLDGGTVRLTEIPEGPIQLAFGPAGAIHYQEIGWNQRTSAYHAYLAVDDNPKFGDIRGITMSELVDLLFIPGAGIGGGSATLPSTGQQQMTLVGTFEDGQGEVKAVIGRSNPPLLDLWFQDLTTVQTQGLSMTFKFGADGGAIRKFNAGFEGNVLKMDGSKTRGIVDMKMTVGTGNSDASPILKFDDLYFIPGGYMGYHAEGSIGSMGFELDGHVERFDSLDYEVYADLDLDAWWAGSYQDTEEIGMGHSTSEMSYKKWGYWIVKYRVSGKI